jgi:hypothetical protein
LKFPIFPSNNSDTNIIICNLGGILPDQPVTWTLEADSEIDMNDIHFLSSTARSCLQTPLIKLRCLCDHPQVGAYGVR